jgi:opacity protein-like surface antigen
MKSVLTGVLAIACLATTACASEAVGPPVTVAERDSRYQTVDHRSRSRYAELEDALYTVLARCEAVQRQYDLPVECSARMYRGYATMLVSFVDIDAVDRYGSVVLDYVGMPFRQVLRSGRPVAGIPACCHHHAP